MNYNESTPTPLKFLVSNGDLVDESGNVIAHSDSLEDMYKKASPQVKKFLLSDGSVVDENNNLIIKNDYFKQVYEQAEPKVAKYLHADGTIDENPGSGSEGIPAVVILLYAWVSDNEDVVCTLTDEPSLTDEAYLLFSGGIEKTFLNSVDANYEYITIKTVGFEDVHFNNSGTSSEIDIAEGKVVYINDSRTVTMRGYGTKEYGPGINRVTQEDYYAMKKLSVNFHFTYDAKVNIFNKSSSDSFILLDKNNEDMKAPVYMTHLVNARTIIVRKGNNALPKIIYSDKDDYEPIYSDDMSDLIEGIKFHSVSIAPGSIAQYKDENGNVVYQISLSDTASINEVPLLEGLLLINS